MLFSHLHYCVSLVFQVNQSDLITVPTNVFKYKEQFLIIAPRFLSWKYL